MNYSRSMKRKKQNKYLRRLILSWLICVLMGIVIGTVIGCAVRAMPKDTPSEEPKNFTDEVQQTELEALKIPPAYKIAEPEEPKEPEKQLLGNWRITAYCSCEKCCGEWAKNRPNGIVNGAAGVELKAGVSVASPLPFGTRVYIEGYGEYVVQDRTATWVAEKYNDEIVDIYFDNHEAACDFGLQYLDVYKIIESEDENND